MALPRVPWERFNVALPEAAQAGSLRLLLASNGPAPRILLLCVHGLLAVAESFEPLAQHLLAAHSRLAVACLDLRGHGESAPLPARPAAPPFPADVALAAAFAVARFSPPPPVVLFGHSLGGAAVARAAGGGAWPPSLPLAGLIVADFVEGGDECIKAQAALLAALPRAFPSSAAAEAWAAAASREAGCATGGGAGHAAAVARALVGEGGAGGGGLVWQARAALDAASDPRELAPWIAGASEAFLVARCPKLLLLAAAASLSGNTALTLASMQGRFQTKVVAGGGHWLHEECPGVVAAAVAAFLARL